MSTNDVRVAIYRSFVESARPPMPAELSAGLGLSPSEVAGSLEELAADDVIALLPGTHFVWLAHPFSAAAGPFRVTSGERRWDAICIWDALGILALTAADGGVSTHCPDCGETLAVTVADGAIQAPADHLVHFGVPAARWYEDVGHT